MIVENTKFNKNPFWNIELTVDTILNDKHCTNLFDQNGYHLTTIEQGDLGYCNFLHFKCAGSRSCAAWVTGGPIFKK